MEDDVKIIQFKYPQFKSDIYILFKDPLHKYFLKERLEELKNFGDIKVYSRIKNIPQSLEYHKPEFISKESYINIYLSQNLILNHGRSSKSSIKTINSLFPINHPVFIKIVDKYKKVRDSNYSFVYSNIFYKSTDKTVFQFIFYLGDLLDDSNLITKLLELIYNYEIQFDENLISLVQNTISQRDKFKYFEFKNNQWKIVNPLIRISERVNKEFKKRGDNRIRKPSVFVRRWNFLDRIPFDTNWILKSGKLRTFMTQPNDVSIYSNISKVHLEKGKKFYDEKVSPRLSDFWGNSPTDEQQKEYFDYFETIIISIIFSYTSIETFVNICIPSYYEHTIVENGQKKTLPKQKIEKSIPLREKLKEVIRQILNTPDPTKEKWWDDFNELESLRKEIIHSKQSKSEDRYSKLLSSRIFKVIQVNQKIIQYYGKYISQNRPELLEDYPYDYGYDEFLSGLMDNKNFDSVYNSLYNPSDK